MKPRIRSIPLLVGVACLVLSAACAGAWYAGGPAPGKLGYKVYHKPTVMTFAYKAYGSPQAADGKYWMARVVVDNTGGRPLSDVRVSYRIPDYLDWTTPELNAELLPGQTAVVALYPKLPARVTQTRTRTPATLEIKLEHTDGGRTHERIERREFEFRGVNEVEYTSLPASEVLDWFDIYSNNEILAALVTDEDDAVKQYLGKISETQGGVNVISDQKTLLQFLKSCYDFQVQTGMTYAAAKGVPEQIGDVAAYTQSIRLPRDVIAQNSGLCIELAILQASLAQAAGAKAYLVMIPGHCYPLLQAPDGSMVAIESTGIGGANLGGTKSFEEAIQIGMKELEEATGGKVPATIVDVGQMQARGIRPPELDRTDLAALTRTLQDRLDQRRGGGGQPRPNDQTALVRNDAPQPDAGGFTPPNPNVNPNPDGGGGGGGDGGFTPMPPDGGGGGGDGGDDGGGFTPMPPPDRGGGGGGGGGGGPPQPQVAGNVYRSRLGTVAFPQGFVPNPQLVTQMKPFAPFYAFNVADPNQQVQIDVFEFAPGDVGSCLQQIVNTGNQFGLQYQVGQPGPVQFGGQQAFLYPLQCFNPNTGMVLHGGVLFLPGPAGVLGVGILGPPGTNAPAQAMQFVAAQSRAGGAR